MQENPNPQSNEKKKSKPSTRRQQLAQRAQNQLAPVPHTTLMTKCKKIMADVTHSVIVYERTPLKKPRVDEEAFEAGAISRTIQVGTYTLFRMEYALGTDGWIRGWTLTWLKLTFCFLIPSVALLVILLILRPIASTASSVAQSLAQIASYIVSILLSILAIVILLPIISIVAVFWKRQTYLHNHQDRISGNGTSSDKAVEGEVWERVK